MGVITGFYGTVSSGTGLQELHCKLLVGNLAKKKPNCPKCGSRMYDIIQTHPADSMVVYILQITHTTTCRVIKFQYRLGIRHLYTCPKDRIGHRAHVALRGRIQDPRQCSPSYGRHCLSLVTTIGC